MITVEEVEDLIRRLPAVQAVRVVVSDWGAIQEIHVLAGNERPAKQIVRDVESSLMARWGLVIDHKCISVAQLVPREPPPLALRVRLLDVQILNDRLRHLARVRVRLGLLDEAASEPSFSCEGSAEGGELPPAVWFAAAAATVNALNQMVDPGWQFAARGAACLEVGGEQVAVVCLGALAPGGEEESLAGAAVVRGEKAEAVVRAVLSAVNRRLGKACAGRARREWSAGEEGGGALGE